MKISEKNKVSEELSLTGLEQSLSFGLKALAIITLLNIAIMYWLPMQVPLSSFSTIKLMFLAYGKGYYILIPVCILICCLLFAGGWAVQKRKILFPVLVSFYLLYDLIELILLSTSDYLANNGYLKSDLASMMITLLLEVLLCIYCTLYWKNNLDLRKRVVVQILFWFLVTCCLMATAGQCITMLQS